MKKEEKSTGIEHECELEPEENEFALAQMITSGWFINLRRQIWWAIFISRNDSRSVRTYRSSYVICLENVRKLQQKNYVIHPFSILRTVWELWMSLVFVITYIFPFYRHFRDYSMISSCFNYVRYTLSTFNVLDVLVNFNTGFQYSNTGQVVCERGAIARQYLCSMLIFDLLSLPGYCLFDPKYLVIDYVQYGEFLLLLRLPTLIKYTHNLKLYRSSHAQYTMTEALLPITIIALWIEHMFYVFNKNYLFDEDSDIYHLHRVTIVVRTMSDLFQMGYSAVYGQKASLLDFFVYVAGFVLELVVMAFIFKVMRVHTHLVYKYLDVKHQIESYANIKRLPIAMRSKMLEYMQYKFVHSKFQERDLMNALPISLQKELITCLYSQLLEKSVTFHNMPMEIILKLTSRVTTALFMPSDVIVQAGTIANIMFFIRCGMAAIYSQSGKELRHLTNGCSFGELALVENEIRNATVVAIDWCEVCMLTRADLLAVFNGYPDLFDKLKLDVHKRSAYTTQSDSWSMQSNESGSLSINTSSATLVQI